MKVTPNECIIASSESICKIEEKSLHVNSLSVNKARVVGEIEIDQLELRRVEFEAKQVELESVTMSLIGLVQQIAPPCPNDFYVTFLGTGSAAPSLHRCNSCVMLKIPIPPTYFIVVDQ